VSAVGGQAWQLTRPDGGVLGRLVQDAVDPPWRLCRFEAGAGFSDVAELFAEDLGLIEEDEMDAWAMVSERITALGLELRPVGGGAPIRDFVLHVDGDRAWFQH
jgi:hypothetical protein